MWRPGHNHTGKSSLNCCTGPDRQVKKSNVATREAWPRYNAILLTLICMVIELVFLVSAEFSSLLHHISWLDGENNYTTDHSNCMVLCMPFLKFGDQILWCKVEHILCTNYKVWALPRPCCAVKRHLGKKDSISMAILLIGKV